MIRILHLDTGRERRERVPLAMIDHTVSQP